jgi:hypothetical protein
MSDLFAPLLTKLISNTIYDTPEGACEVYLKNTGGSNAIITGNATGSEAVILASGEVLELRSLVNGRFIGNGRRSINVDATGTTVRVMITL